MAPEFRRRAAAVRPVARVALLLVCGVFGFGACSIPSGCPEGYERAQNGCEVPDAGSDASTDASRDVGGWGVPDAGKDAGHDMDGSLVDAGYADAGMQKADGGELQRDASNACFPVVETCDGKDNDCDGVVDNGVKDAWFGQTCSNGGQGACDLPGTYGCVSGVKVCSAPSTPSTETCDGKDNDCDGVVDNGFMTGAPCMAGVGECHAAGTVQCTSPTTAVCNAVAKAPAPAEVCGDGKDNDCDGVIDNPAACTPVAHAATVTQVAMGSTHGCAVLSTGAVKCWGSNGNGELGLPSEVFLPPTAVPGITTAAGVAAGQNFTCALLSSGAVQCWGLNASGQLGDGGNQDSAQPKTVSGVANATRLSAGYAQACAVLSDSTVSCWGSGYGTSAVAVPVLSGVKDVSVGDFFACGLRPSGVVVCAGDNSLAQLGFGAPGTPQSTNSINILTASLNPNTALNLSAGNTHACAVLSGGVVSCWGSNNRGQLGNPALATGPSDPQNVPGLSGASQVAAGSAFSCAVLSGAVSCWGDGRLGQLGDGMSAMRASPKAISLPAQASKISAGVSATCAILASGVVNCWGDNEYGQLGDGTTNPSLVPVSAKVLP